MQSSSAARVASAYTLIAPQSSSWAMPRLDGIQSKYRVWQGDRIAAAAGLALLKAGVAEPVTWDAAGNDPFDFLQTSLCRFVERHGGAAINELFHLNLALTDSLDSIGTEKRDRERSDLFLVLEPSEAGYLDLGATIRRLEELHPRLPATFFSFLTGALNRWVRIYDYRDALDRVAVLRDWYDADPDSEPVDLPDVAGSIPASIARQPLSRRGLESILPKITTEPRTWLEKVLVLDDLSRQHKRPRLTEEMERQMGDTNPPLPSLLVVFAKSDATEGCFDDEAQAMLEVMPEPNLIVPLNVGKPKCVRETFNMLACVCKTLAAASELLKMLPDSGA